MPRNRQPPPPAAHVCAGSRNRACEHCLQRHVEGCQMRGGPLNFPPRGRGGRAEGGRRASTFTSQSPRRGSSYKEMARWNRRANAQGHVLTRSEAEGQ